MGFKGQVHLRIMVGKVLNDVSFTNKLEPLSEDLCIL